MLSARLVASEGRMLGERVEWLIFVAKLNLFINTVQLMLSVGHFASSFKRFEGQILQLWMVYP